MNLILIIAALVLLLVFKDDIFGAYNETIEPVEQYPIVYPLENMFENFISIKEKIDQCETKKDFDTAYIRIIIFQGCYPDASSFLGELIEYYHLKETSKSFI